MITFQDKKIPWHPNITISEILKQVAFGNRYAVVKLNGKFISKPEFESTTVIDNSYIAPLPMISGG